MLDDDARRALEEEAIALVSLSRPALRFSPQDAQQQQQQQLSQVGKASAGQSDSVKLEPNTSAAANAGPDTQEDAAKRAVVLHHHRHHHGGSEELYAQNPEQPQTQTQPDGGSISMKSLLVTLKKRKLSPAPSEDAAENERVAKALPSFRDVFEPPRQPSPPQQTGEPSSQPEEPQAAAPVTGSASATPTELKYKCKYRTGKCSNVRALKSCGDYHNLCNYHRLRANANQRKLDRKKKVQRLQVLPAGAAAAAAAAAAVAAMASAVESEPPAAAAAAAAILPSTTVASTSSSPASVASALLCAPSVAAAVALVAMPSSAPKPLHQHQQ